MPSPKTETIFDYHFTLEEAVAILPEVEALLQQARDELAPIRDDLILYKRLHNARLQTPMGSDGAEAHVFEEKLEQYQKVARKWVQALANRHVVVQDLERGLVDFPYRAADGEEFLLCWLQGEDGILHFHDLDSGFRGRMPITLLPD